MRRQSFNQGHSKVWVYALVIALVLGVCLVVVQDIKVPTEHITKDIEVSLEK